MKNQLIKTGTIIAVFITVCFSCQREELNDPPQVDEAMTVAEAQAWFQANHDPALTLKSKKVDKGKPVDVEVKWNNSSKSKNDKVEVVEAHLSVKGHLGFATQRAIELYRETKEMGYISSLSKLVVLKDKKTGEMQSFIMTIFGETGYLVKKNFNIMKNTYLKKDKDFTGYVFFHSLQGEFVNGWWFDGGKVTGKVAQNSNNSPELRLKSTCYEVSITLTSESYTDWYVNGELDRTVYNGTTTEIVDQYTVCSSAGAGGIDGSGSLPVVDITGLKQIPKIDCIYDKLIQGKVINNFMRRYFGLSEPIHSFLGELDLFWTVQDLSIYDTEELDYLALTRPIGDPSGSGYFVEIAIDKTHIADHSTSAIAYSMLHEAAHAKLIAGYYDETGTTNFKTLFKEHNDLYGPRAQHFEMYMSEYINQLATGVREFDALNGINRSLLFYQRAIKYQLGRQLDLIIQGGEGKTEDDDLFYNSPKDCD